MHMDNTQELDSLVSAWILEMGGKQEPTPPYTSKYNSITEWFNREVMTHSRCLLFNASLPKMWWAEAARHTCDVINITPTCSNPGHTSPFQLQHGQPPPSQHLIVFGALGMMRLQNHERHKLSAQSTAVRFMGIVDYSSLTYRVYIVGQCWMIETCNVVFDERSAS
jgi:hypothetical protein